MTFIEQFFAFIVIKIQILLISLKFQILQDLGNVLIKFWKKNLFLKCHSLFYKVLQVQQIELFTFLMVTPKNKRLCM